MPVPMFTEKKAGVVCSAAVERVARRREGRGARSLVSVEAEAVVMVCGSDAVEMDIGEG